MAQLGMTLSAEEHGPARLVELARAAEEHGFDFVSVSDHFHPWVSEQGHSPFVWSLLGAISEATDELDVAVGVTCPIMRIHPAVLAQAVATTGALLEGRFTWGVGTGEALNEHVVGGRWPPVDVRLDMLKEAVGVVRELLSGDSVTHRGKYFTVENATLYDLPAAQVPIVVSAFGPEAAELAAEIGDGLWITGTDSDTVEQWRENGGEGSVWSQLTFCHHADADEAAKIAARQWPNTAVVGQLSQDLPTTTHFRDATAHVDAELMAEQIPCGPDPEPVIAAINEAVDAGVTNVYLHQIGDHQEAFLRWWDEEIAPAVADLRS